jgi:chromosome segregation ATPase
MQEKLAVLETAVQAATTERDSATSEAEVTRRLAEDKEAELGVKLAELESALAVARDAAEGSGHAAAEAMRSTVDNLEREVLDLTRALDTATSDLTALRAESERSESQRAGRKAELDQLEAKLADAGRAVKAAQSERDDLEQRMQARIAELGGRVEMAEKARADVQALLDESGQRVDKAEAARDALQVRLDEAVSTVDAEVLAAGKLIGSLQALEARLADAEKHAAEHRGQSEVL